MPRQPRHQGADHGSAGRELRHRSGRWGWMCAVPSKAPATATLMENSREKGWARWWEMRWETPREMHSELGKETAKEEEEEEEATQPAQPRQNLPGAGAQVFAADRPPTFACVAHSFCTEVPTSGENQHSRAGGARVRRQRAWGKGVSK